ncbi:hypothetical protein Y981_02735 [Leptospirillum ferriphilum YSK]|jgi:hypothetical protein|uniref:Uncharacterized protein n=1 Tax=Leptospirillum ferriphilum YSK TaxID=1441628 RepID=A0A059Y1Y8_9BACT|nr:hypothetical protein Y981_02735 [Leptospirillum ferriphilum YSK]
MTSLRVNAWTVDRQSDKRMGPDCSLNRILNRASSGNESIRPPLPGWLLNKTQNGQSVKNPGHSNAKRRTREEVVPVSEKFVFDLAT